MKPPEFEDRPAVGPPLRDSRGIRRREPRLFEDSTPRAAAGNLLSAAVGLWLASLALASMFPGAFEPTLNLIFDLSERLPLVAAPVAILVLACGAAGLAALLLGEPTLAWFFLLATIAALLLFAGAAVALAVSRP